MKIAKSYLTQIINEEIKKLIEENDAKQQSIDSSAAMQKSASTRDPKTSFGRDSAFGEIDQGSIDFFGFKLPTTLNAKKPIINNTGFNILKFEAKCKEVAKKISEGDEATETKLIIILKNLVKYSQVQSIGVKPIEIFLKAVMRDYLKPEDGTIAGSQKLYRLYEGGALGAKPREILKNNVTYMARGSITSRTTNKADAIPTSGAGSVPSRMSQVRE